MSMQLTLDKGRISVVKLQRPTDFRLTDCMNDNDGFVNVSFTDGEHTSEVYVPTPMVSRLLAEIAGLFAPKT